MERWIDVIKWRRVIKKNGLLLNWLKMIVIT